MKKILYHITNQNKNLDDVLKRDKNNFDLLRLIASFAVIYGHSFFIFPSHNPEPIGEYLKFTLVGGLAVAIFFFLSGILVTGSFINSQNIFNFVFKRIARIWPGIIVCILLTVFVIGPIFSALSITDYFKNQNTWIYLKTNILLFKVNTILPGVFINNFYKNAVNGSIWTLPIEIRCYLYVLIAGLLGLFRKKWIFALFAIFIIISFKYFNDTFTLIFGYVGAIFFLIFLAGSISYLLRKKLIINPYIDLVLIFFWVLIGNKLPYYQVSFYSIFAYTCLVFVSNKYIVSIKLFGDFSYGVFIYGFVVQQIIAHFDTDISAYQSMLITFPVAFLIAIFSWFYIEKPCLRYAHNYKQKKLLKTEKLFK